MFLCDVCGLVFNVKKKLSDHLRIHDEEEKTCEICMNVVEGCMSLANHMRIHKGRNDQRKKSTEYHCSKFNYFTTRKDNLKRHESGCGVSKDAIKHECTICQKVFARINNLQRHLK